MVTEFCWCHGQFLASFHEILQALFSTHAATTEKKSPING